jgi:hypothetical protein
VPKNLVLVKMSKLARPEPARERTTRGVVNFIVAVYMCCLSFSSFLSGQQRQFRASRINQAVPGGGFMRIFILLHGSASARVLGHKNTSLASGALPRRSHVCKEESVANKNRLG